MGGKIFHPMFLTQIFLTKSGLWVAPGTSTQIQGGTPKGNRASGNFICGPPGIRVGVYGAGATRTVCELPGRFSASRELASFPPSGRVPG